MKKNMQKILLVLTALILCFLFGSALFFYTVPMEDKVYDLSLSWEGESMPENWIYDQKGWTVFTQEENERTVLEPDGLGGFLGLSYPGQTFYFSRSLTEKLDSPDLRLGTANRNFAVFLDGELIYTDCPDLDNRIGFLKLPMLDYDRQEPIVLSLPNNYRGKTLTIAQSTALGDKNIPDSKVYPCSVTLYCGYSYESSLIAESFQTAIPAALFFGAGVILTVIFLWQMFFRKADIGLVFLALTSFLWSVYHIAGTSFVYSYVDVPPLDFLSLSRLFCLTVLLAFLSSRLNGKRRLILGILSVLHGISVFIYAIMNFYLQSGFLWLDISHWLGLTGLLTVLFFTWPEFRKSNRFFQFFLPFIGAGIIFLTVQIIFSASLRKTIIQQFFLSHEYFLWKFALLITPAAILAAVIQIIEQEILHETEKQMLKQQYKLAQSGFENLQHHSEEVMMLRHDMTKHLTFLRQSTADPKTAAYLDELLGQQQAIRPVLQTQNKTLDIIINAKLDEAARLNIKTEIIQSDAPKTLPLSDSELCALIMNVMDNAIAAAQASGEKTPFLYLDMHCKDGFFVFVCENSASLLQSDKKAKKETMPKHGLGLKIIEQIVKKHGDLVEVTRMPDSYRTTIAVLLDQPFK